MGKLESSFSSSPEKATWSNICSPLASGNLTFLSREKMLHLGVEQNDGRPLNSQVSCSLWNLYVFHWLSLSMSPHVGENKMCQTHYSHSQFSFSLREHLQMLTEDHIRPNHKAMTCPWPIMDLVPDLLLTLPSIQIHMMTPITTMGHWRWELLWVGL